MKSKRVGKPNPRKQWFAKSVIKVLPGWKSLPSIRLVGFVLVFAGLGIYFLLRSFAAVPEYYVDCAAGSDANTGTSIASPWKTLTKASQAPLTAGGALYLKRGCSWSDQLKAGWTGTAASPITIGAYGSGELPIVTSNVNGREMITVTGAYLIFENIYAKAVPPALEAGCQNTPKGYVVGFAMLSGAHDNIIRNSKATGGYAGVSLKSGSHHNKVLNNQLTDNNMMNPVDTAVNNDAGAFGVAIFGDDNEVANNMISGSYACSYDYDGDGSAVELYGGQRNSIHHNQTSNNEAFTELGNNRTRDNTYAYNFVTSNIRTSTFLITRGSADSSIFGPIEGTKAYNNTVYYTGSESDGAVCHAGCTPSILTLRNNIIWVGDQALFADAPFNESNNIYWKTGSSPITNITGGAISGTSKKVDPQFVALGSDFRLKSTSPAINAGSSESVTAGYILDLDAKTVPINGAVDIGAYEFGASSNDTTDPTVVWTAPAAGATISGTLFEATNSGPSGVCEVSASDNVAVTKVLFYVDNSLLNQENASPWNCNFDTTLVANGTHTLKAEAYDAAGNMASSTRSVNVQNGGDTTPPSTPANLRLTGVTSSSVSMAWNASTDNSGGSGLAGYKVLRAGSLIATLPAGTTTYTNTGLTPLTTYSYTVVAYDQASSPNTSGSSNTLSACTPSTFKAGEIDGAPPVTAHDLSLLLSNYGKTTYPAGNFDGDCTVTAHDLSLLLGNFGT